MRRRNIGDTREDEPKIAISDESVEDDSFGLKSLCKWICLFILLLYLLIPIILFVAPQIAEQLVFLNLQVGKNEVQSLSHPASAYGLHGTGTFYIECDDVKLGVWHILPKNKMFMYKDDDLPGEDSLASALQDAEEVTIYLHGSAMSRATGEGEHRADFYKFLQKEGFHTIAFDYRGFGDSSGWPSELGLARDFQCVTQWISKRSPNDTRILAWGHSLGAAVLALSMRMIASDCESNMNSCLKVDGIILEGGFTNLMQGAKDSYPAYLFNHVYPSFLLEMLLDHAFAAKHISLATDENLAKVKGPILLVHSEDDNIIPFYHGLELFEVIKHSKHPFKHRFIQFQGHHKYSHNYMYRCEKLYELIREFFHGNGNPIDDVISV